MDEFPQVPRAGTPRFNRRVTQVLRLLGTLSESSLSTNCKLGEALHVLHHSRIIAFADLRRPLHDGEEMIPAHESHPQLVFGFSGEDDATRKRTYCIEL